MELTKQKRSKLLLVSWILSALYLLALIVYISTYDGASSGAEQAGAALAFTLMFPHLVAVAVGLLFNILGWALHRRGLALTGGILYTVAMVLFPLYFFFVIIQVILSFVGYSKMKK